MSFDGEWSFSRSNCVFNNEVVNQATIDTYERTITAINDMLRPKQQTTVIDEKENVVKFID